MPLVLLATAFMPRIAWPVNSCWKMALSCTMSTRPWERSVSQWGRLPWPIFRALILHRVCASNKPPAGTWLTAMFIFLTACAKRAGSVAKQVQGITAMIMRASRWSSTRLDVRNPVRVQPCRILAQ